MRLQATLPHKGGTEIELRIDPGTEELSTDLSIWQLELLRLMMQRTLFKIEKRMRELGYFHE